MFELPYWRSQIDSLDCFDVLHINVQKGSSCVRCVVLLHIMHNILFKSDTVDFDFLASKSTQELGFWVGIRGNQMLFCLAPFLLGGLDAHSAHMCC
jgi:hypothetical protein